MQIQYEELAKDLIASGRLRVDTDYQCNFARYTDPTINSVTIMISKIEITEEKLVQKTRELIASLYRGKLDSNKIQSKVSAIIKNLKLQIERLRPVSDVTILKLARLFVQSAHPIVIRWLIRDNVEVFITYSHNIGDMMDIQNWKHSGQNSGMQRTDGKNAAIFVSCGGDPFASADKKNPTFGNGWPAVARLQIIASQELGHFADIKRDELGRQISRHSANFSGTRAHDYVKIARKNDIKTCDELLAKLNPLGLKKLLIYEEKLKFYHKNKVTSLRVFFLEILRFIFKHKILLSAKHHKILFIKRFAKDQYMAIMLRTIIHDMKFNLEPIADVYIRPDKEEQEAIACIEALARVPQQVIKWGHLATMSTTPRLYNIYYNQVIRSLIENYSTLTKEPYIRNFSIVKKTFKYRIKNFFSSTKKLEQLKPLRDL